MDTAERHVDLADEIASSPSEVFDEHADILIDPATGGSVRVEDGSFTAMDTGRSIDVVAYGPSAHDENSYFLIRSFASVDQRQRSEDAFYGSEEWRLGPRQAVLDLIESYTTVVLELAVATVDGLRHHARAAR